MQSKFDFDYDYHQETLVAILKEIIAMPQRPNGDVLSRVLRKYPRQDDKSMHSRTQLVQAYRKFAGNMIFHPMTKSKWSNCAVNRCEPLAVSRL
ncbi:MAG: hypothetical protein Q9P01_03045 [Anaerolineae bacterium]|nr:hypothetical protein [Anaerolineae bacterium]